MENGLSRPHRADTLEWHVLTLVVDKTVGLHGHAAAHIHLELRVVALVEKELAVR